MFKTTINSGKLKSVLDVLETITEEAKFKISPDGIKVSAVDPATVAMTSLELSKDTFSVFEVTECELGIDIKKLSGILEMAEKDDNIELELDEVSHKLTIRMRGIAYTMSLLDPSTIRKEPKVPNLEMPVKVEITGEQLKRAVKASEKVSEYMRIGIEAGCLLMSASDETDSIRLLLGKEECKSMNPGVQGDVGALFSLDYLSDISKVAASADSVMLELGKDMPLILKFKIADGYGNVYYMIAPRISED